MNAIVSGDKELLVLPVIDGILDRSATDAEKKRYCAYISHAHRCNKE
jgi:hypothetical protein